MPPVVLGDLQRWGALLARYVDSDGAHVLGGLEPLWGFSCPVLLPDPEVHAGEFAEALSGGRWDRVVITGLGERSRLFRELARSLHHLADLYRGEGIHRCVAEIGDGYDGWLGRRSSRFRQQLRRRERAAAAAGITFDDVQSPDGLMERLLAVEARAWKQDEGMASSAMATMYEAMIDRLGRRRRLRAFFARLDGRDVGFILGGVRAGIYRGLQLSYAADTADLEIGHLLQAHQLQRLPGVRTYDLGMDMAYKRRWADRVIPTTVLVARRR